MKKGAGYSRLQNVLPVPEAAGDADASKSDSDGSSRAPRANELCFKCEACGETLSGAVAAGGACRCSDKSTPPPVPARDCRRRRRLGVAVTLESRPPPPPPPAPSLGDEQQRAGTAEQKSNAAEDSPGVESEAAALVLCQYQLSACGWYYSGMSCDAAHRVLASRPQGTFLLRDSSHPHHMFALSVNTSKGVSSVRIQHRAGAGFSLDTVSHAAPAVESGAPPRRDTASSCCSFPDVVSLVRYYVTVSEAQRWGGRSGRTGGAAAGAAAGQWVLSDGSGNMVTIGLRRPLLLGAAGVPQLQHLARLVLNRRPDLTMPSHTRRPIPKLISHYLLLYPYEF